MQWSSQSQRGLAELDVGTTAVVGLRPDVGAEEFLLGTALDLTLVSSEPSLHAIHVTGTTGQLDALVDLARTDDRIRYIEPVRVRSWLHDRNDPLTTQLDPLTNQRYEWQFGAVGLDAALNVSRGAPTMLVGVLDSGLSDIPDLRGKIAERWYFTNQSVDALDGHGHGTFVSSLIASNNDDGFGLGGFCGSCRLISFKDIELNVFSEAQAIRHLVSRGVRIINMSFGGPFPSLIELDAINFALSSGVLLVAASGNDGGAVSYPAAYLQPNSGALGYGLAVGASDINGNRASFSNWGSRLSLLAPGTYNSTPCTPLGVLAAVPAGAPMLRPGCTRWFGGTELGSVYALASGTSFSAPIVAGIAALVWAARPELRNYQIADLLMQSAARPIGSGWAPDRGWGVVNAARALELATGQSTRDTVTIDRFTTNGAPRPKRAYAISASVTWQDGTSIPSGTTDCEASIAGRSLQPIVGSVGSGSVVCTWRIPANTGGRRIFGTVHVSDQAGNVGVRGFSTLILRSR